MRTTVTLDADTDALVRLLMHRRGLTFKEAVNQAIRAGTAEGVQARFETPSFDMGEPKVPLDKALRLAGELEDEEIIRKMALRK